ncbi:MAG: autotransporter-associated beta strand repeat-containing protein, partial [Actinobacteria bacterium]|nr:autotransporter-associated beta strand repeat-containing protein [Actinomycetota bacterium]
GTATFSTVVISGAYAVTKTGAGTVVLSSTNTYTGATTIAAGILNANSTDALGDGSSTNTLIFAGGTLQAGGTITSPSTRLVTLTSTGLIDTNSQSISVTSGATLDVAGYSISRPVTLNGGTILSSTGASGALTGGVTLGAATSFFASDSSAILTISTAITDSTNTYTVTSGTSGNTGAVIFSTANTYDGGTTVAYGTLKAGNTSAFGSGKVTVGAAGSTSTLDIYSYAIGNAIDLYGTGVSIGGALQNTNTGQSLAPTLTGTITLMSNTSVGGTADYVLNASSSNISGAFTLTKVGANTITLSDSNTYSGGTTVSAGTLKAGTSNAFGPSGTIIVSSGATLDVAGIPISRLVNLNGGTVLSSTGSGGSLTGGVTLGAANSYFAAANSMTLSITTTVITDGLNAYGVTSGTSGNTGTVLFSTTNTYDGGATVAYGTLKAGFSGAFGPSGTIIVSSGATLDVAGIPISRLVNLNGGTVLSSTGSGGSLTGGVSLGAASYFAAGSSAVLTISTLAIDDSTNSYTVTTGTSGNAGTVLFSTTNTYDGGTTVAYGVLKSGSATALGAGSVTVNLNAALDLNGQTMTSTGTLTLNGTGILSGGALFNSTTTASTYAGPLALGSASSIISGTSTGTILLTSSTAITGATYTLTLGGAAGGTITAPLGTSVAALGALTKSDGGTWALNGANNYIGDLTISGGTLKIGGSSVLGSGTYSGAISIASGATFKYSSSAVQTLSTGVISGAGSLVKDTGIDTLTLSGANTYSGGTT